MVKVSATSAARATPSFRTTRVGRGCVASQRTPLTDLGSRQARDAGQRVRRAFRRIRLRLPLGLTPGHPDRGVDARGLQRRGTQGHTDSTQPVPARARYRLHLRHDNGRGRRGVSLAARALEHLRWVFARPPGGESLADVAQRVYLFLGMLFRDRAGARVMVVSHSGTMRMFRYLLERWTYDDVVERWSAEPISNCGVVAYRFNQSEARLVRADQRD